MEAEKQREAAEAAQARAEQQAREREAAMQENIRQLETKMAEELANERRHHEEVGDSITLIKICLTKLLFHYCGIKDKSV